MKIDIGPSKNPLPFENVQNTAKIFLVPRTLLSALRSNRLLKKVWQFDALKVVQVCEKKDLNKEEWRGGHTVSSKTKHVKRRESIKEHADILAIENKRRMSIHLRRLTKDEKVSTTFDRGRWTKSRLSILATWKNKTDTWPKVLALGVNSSNMDFIYCIVDTPQKRMNVIDISFTVEITARKKWKTLAPHD